MGQITIHIPKGKRDLPLPFWWSLMPHPLYFSSKVFCSSDSARILKLVAGSFQYYTFTFHYNFSFFEKNEKWLFPMLVFLLSLSYYIVCFVFFRQGLRSHWLAQTGLELLAVLLPNLPSTPFLLTKHFRLTKLNNDILCKEVRLKNCGHTGPSHAP